MNLKTALTIAFISVVSTLIPLLCFIIFRKGQPRQNRILTISLCISLIFDVVGWILAEIYRNNILSNNLFIIVAFPAIMWFYHETLVKMTLKIIVRIFTVTFLVLALIFGIDQGLNVYNYNTMTLSSILVTITSFFFVGDLKLMDDSTFLKNPFHKTNIILNTSLATYYFFSIVVFALHDYVVTYFGHGTSRYLWVLHNAVHILKNLGIAVALYLTAKRAKELIDGQFKNTPHNRPIN